MQLSEALRLGRAHRRVRGTGHLRRCGYQYRPGELCCVGVKAWGYPSSFFGVTL